MRCLKKYSTFIFNSVFNGPLIARWTEKWMSILYTDLVVLQSGETFDNNDYGSDNNGGDGQRNEESLLGLQHLFTHAACVHTRLWRQKFMRCVNVTSTCYVLQKYGVIGGLWMIWLHWLLETWRIQNKIFGKEIKLLNNMYNCISLAGLNSKRA